MAKVFKFRLERLADFRRLREDVARADLAKASLAVREQNKVLLQALREDQECKDAFRKLQQKDLDVVQIRLQEGYLGSLERRIRRELDRLQELTREEGRKRRMLMEARKEVRVLERLRDRQQGAYRYELGREERKILDEVGQNTRRATS